MIKRKTVPTGNNPRLNRSPWLGRKQIFELPSRKLMPVIGAVALLLMAGLWPVTSFAADPADVEDFLATGSCPGCDLSEAFLDTVDASGGDLWNARLKNSSLYRANLELANLSGADLTGANLRKASLKGADLRQAKLVKADLTDALFDFADLTGAHTNETTICPDGAIGPCDFSEGN